MLQEFCPDCGTRRVALFRWCRSCGLDYDDLDARGELPGGPYSKGIVAAAAAMASATDTKAGTSSVSAASAPDAPGPATAGPRRTTKPSRGGVSALRRRSIRRPVSRSLAFVLAAVLALGLLGGAYAADLGGVQTTVATFTAGSGVVPAAAPVPSADPVPTPEPSFVPSGPTSEATVERVIDGDTIVVDAGGARLYVHYLGIDAPEAVTLDSPVQFMGPEASQANAQLVSGQTVILERDVSEADSAARLLRDVWVDRDGTLFLVGLELVKAGFARAVPQPPDVKYQALYADAEAQAKAAGLGIWGTPPSMAPEATLPPTPAGATQRLTTNDPTTFSYGFRSDFHGAEGSYTWRAVNVMTSALKVAWTVDAASAASCAFDWSIAPASGTAVSGEVSVPRKGRETGQSDHETPFRKAILTVTSTCPVWRLSVTGEGS